MKTDCAVYVCQDCLRASCLSGAAECPARADSRRPRANVVRMGRYELELLGREIPEYWDTPDQEMWRGAMTEVEEALERGARETRRAACL